MRLLRGFVRVVLVATAALWASASFGQTTTASLRGTIRSQEGRPVADVIVRARSLESGRVRAAVSDALGKYRFDLIQPGTWMIWAQVPGSPAGAEREVTLGLLQTVVLDITVGPVAEETVTVVAQRPLIDPLQTGGVLRIDGEQAAELPLAGRVVTDLALLDSAVASSAPGDFFGERGTVFTVNGQSGRANTFLVDGMDNNDQTSNTSMNAPFSQLVIREFVVETRNFAPEFGRASGGILNIITERGSNENTGELFFQGIAPRLSETGDFVSMLPNQERLDGKPERLQTGLRLGGPLVRDRAFWFFAYEHRESDEVVPFTGVDRDGLPGGWTVAPGRGDSAFFRSDFNLGDSQLMVRLSLDDSETNDLLVAGRRTPEAGFELDEQDLQLAASLTTPLSGTVFNEARLLYGTSTFDQAANSDRPGVERPSGIFGGNSLNGQARDEIRLQLVENLTWLKGNHTAKFGFDILRSTTEVRTRFNPNGNFLYDTDLPYEPGDCLPPRDLNVSQVDPNDLFKPIPCDGDPNIDDDGDGILNEPGIIGTYPVVYSLVLPGRSSATLRDARFGLFIQDSWQATPSFLLEYGLRYDLSTYTLPRGASVSSTIRNGGAKRDTNNVAPRASFSWAPGDEGRFILRGGAGIFYDKLVMSFPAVAAITSGTEIGLIFPQGFAFEITEDLVEQIGVDVLKQGLVFPKNLILRFSTGPEMETPYTVQYSLGGEIGFGARGALSATVTRALGYNIPQMVDLNPVVNPRPLTFPTHANDTVNVGSLATIVTEGRSWYSALDLGWRWRGRANWYRAGYTWSKALDTGPDPLKGGIYLPPSADNLDAERGRADGDRRHRFTLSGGTHLPIWDLRLSGIVQAATGIPFNVTTGNDDNMDGFATDRPDGVARNTGADTNLKQVNALRKNAGLKPVSDLEEPYFLQVDLRVAKPFAVRGGRNPLELFLQVFNLFDRTNGGPVEGSVLSRNFGEPVGMLGPPRTVELGFHLGFGAPPDAPPTPALEPGE